MIDCQMFGTVCQMSKGASLPATLVMRPLAEFPQSFCESHIQCVNKNRPESLCSMGSNLCSGAVLMCI